MQSVLYWMKMKIRNFFMEEKLQLPACTHDWNLFAKNYAAPRRDIAAAGVPEAVFEKALFGVTTYLWECKVCSKIRKEETLGTDENQLYDTLEKAADFGMQYVTYEDKKFGIALVPNETK